jgi:hypothetical protein
VSRDLPWGRIAFAFFGYLAAVLVAVVATMFAILLPTVFPDDGAWGSYYATSRSLGDIFPFVLMTTFLTALPGFLVTLFVARRGGWMGWLPFACAGTLNTVVALAIFDVALGMPDRVPLHMPLLGMPLAILLPCLPGGFAGGFAYWAVVRRSLLSNEEFVWS